MFFVVFSVNGILSFGQNLGTKRRNKRGKSDAVKNRCMINNTIINLTPQSFAFESQSSLFECVDDVDAEGAALGFMSVIMALPTQWLWNSCLVPALDSVNPIGFWQALGLNVLSGILFKSHASSKKEK